MSFTPTDEQEDILAYELEYHARLLAGPGTGKSATLVALLDELLAQEAVSKVKLLTFTRAATGELAKERFALAKLLLGSVTYTELSLDDDGIGQVTKTSDVLRIVQQRCLVGMRMSSKSDLRRLQIILLILIPKKHLSKSRMVRENHRWPMIN